AALVATVLPFPSRREFNHTPCSQAKPGGEFSEGLAPATRYRPWSAAKAQPASPGAMNQSTELRWGTPEKRNTLCGDRNGPHSAWGSGGAGRVACSPRPRLQ